MYSNGCCGSSAAEETGKITMLFLMKYGVNPDVLTYANISVTWTVGTVKAAFVSAMGQPPDPTAKDLFNVWC